MPLDTYNDLFTAAGAKWNVDPELLRAMAGAESNGNPNAYNRKYGAAGIMQFIPDTAKKYGVDPYDAPSAIDGAAHYMSDLLDKHGGNVDRAINEYSGGGGSKYAADVLRWYRPNSPLTASANNPTPSPTQPPPPPQLQQPPPPLPEPPPMPTPAADPEARILEGATGAPDRPDRAAEIEQAILEGKPIPGITQGGAVPGAFRRYVLDPLAAAQDPTLTTENSQPLLGQPALQSTVTGLAQGVRDTGTLVERGDKYLADRFPLYAQLDRMIGHEPGSGIAPQEAQTAAYQQQQGDSWLAPLGRFGGNLITTSPAMRGAAAIGNAVRAIPQVGRYLAPVAEGTGAGGGFNALTSEAKTPEEYLADIMSGAGAGALLGGVFGAGRAYLTRGARPADQAIADRLGIRLSTGQNSGGALKSLEDATATMPGSGAVKFAGQQRQQIADVISREAGMPTGVPINTSTLQAARDRIGSDIDNAVGGINVVATPKLATDVEAIRDFAMMQGNGTNEARVFASLMSRLSNIVQNNGGTLPGSELQGFIKKYGPLDNAIRSKNGDVSQIGERLREALLSAAEAGGTGSQQALDAMQRARYQWKVVQTVRPAMEKTASGSEEMSLPGLAHMIEQKFGGTGPGAEMADLARLIRGPLRSLPSSGTTERNFWQRLLMGELGVGGPVGAGSYFSGMPLAHSIAAGLAFPVAVGTAVGRGLRYGIPGGGNALFNRLLPAIGADVNRPAPPT